MILRYNWIKIQGIYSKRSQVQGSNLKAKTEFFLFSSFAKNIYDKDALPSLALEKGSANEIVEEDVNLQDYEIRQ